MKVKEQILEWNLPCLTQEEEQPQSKKSRTHGGSNLMPVIEGLLSSSENWYEVESSKDYQYPGVFTEQEHSNEPNMHQVPPPMGHVSNLYGLSHFTGQNCHLLYCENQLSKGHYNDNVREVNINGQKQEVHIHYASCKGVLKCSVPSCNFAGSKTTKKCPSHPAAEMVSSGSCPVYIVCLSSQSCGER